MSSIHGGPLLVVVCNLKSWCVSWFLNKRVVMETTTGENAVGRRMKVMVGVDDSTESFYALNWALTNLIKPTTPTASSLGAGDPSQETECFLYLVHVQEPFQNYGFPAGPGFYSATSVVQSVKQAQAEITASLLAKALKICKDKMIRAETLILEGNSKEMICQAVEQIHVDLLVLGSRGLGQIKRAFLGSVSDYCAHYASSPVLIVKPPHK